MLAGVLHGLEEVQAVPVDKIHISRHKDLPAGGQRVVIRVLLLIAPAQQRRNDNFVVRILWEAEALLCERRGKLIDGQRRVFVHAQIDLGVDEAQLAAGDQAQLGQVVIRVGAVLVRAAQYDGLPVVALLDADVKVAVAVAGDEKLLQQLKRPVLCQKPCVQIVPVIGVQELVDTADGIVIVAVAPHGVMQQAQELQRFEKRLGRVGGDLGKRVRNRLVAYAQRLLAVARGEVRHDGKHVQHGLQKFLLLRRFCLFQLRANLFGLFRKAVRHQHPVIGAHIEYAAVFMERVRLVQLPVLFFCVDLRNGAHGAQQRDALIRENDGRFLRQHIAQPCDRALHIVKPLRRKLCGQRVRVPCGLAVGMVRLIADEEIQLLLNMFGLHEAPS